MKAKIFQKLFFVSAAAFFSFFLLIVFFSTNLRAEEMSPAGRWKIVYDGQDEVIYRVWVDNGTLYGRVEKMTINSNADQNPVCSKCSGANKDKPVVGMTFIWGLTQKSDAEWSGGHVLEPDSGKV